MKTALLGLGSYIGVRMGLPINLAAIANFYSNPVSLINNIIMIIIINNTPTNPKKYP